MSALDPVILNEVKLTQRAVADLASSSSSGAVIGAVGQIVRLPTDAAMPSDGDAVYLRSGILTSGEEYPDYPSWLSRYGGITWTQRAMPVSTNWQSVTYGNGLFVAVAYGGAIAATSPDGITWTQRAMPSSIAWCSVTYGDGVFVAVAASSAIAATSPANLIGMDVYTRYDYVRVK